MFPNHYHKIIPRAFQNAWETVLRFSSSSSVPYYDQMMEPSMSMRVKSVPFPGKVIHVNVDIILFKHKDFIYAFFY